MAKSRKKQTQLAFRPLSPDSPASQSQPLATRSRSAAVAISPSNRSKTSKTSAPLLPTPVSPLSKSSPHLVSPKKTRNRSFMTRSTMPRSSPPSSSATKSNLNSDLLEMFNESESDGAPVASAVSSSHRRRNKVVAAPAAAADDDEDDGNENVITPSRARRRKRRGSELEFIDDDELDAHQSQASEQLPSQKRRRLLGRTPRKSNADEVQDLNEDLDFLKSDELDDGPGRYVSSQLSAKRQGKLSALEQLRKSRQKHVPRKAEDEDDDFELAEMPVINDAPNESSDDLEIMDPASPDSAASEDNFIVEDDEEAAEIPLEMRMNLMKDKELFEFAVEWMCQKRLNPAFAYDDGVYATAFRRLDDSMKGLVGSKFQSSAWTAAFTRAIKSRPVLEEVHFVNDGLHDRCDACNRSRHPPTWKVWLQGDPYNQHTLEDESEDEADRGRETKLPNTNTTWYLGRFCMANAKSTHTLAHWRYHLYQWVNEFLDDGKFSALQASARIYHANIGVIIEGHLQPSKVIERDRWSTKRKRDYANQVVDDMKASGVVKRLYKDFKDEKEQAQRGHEEDFALD